MPISALIYDIEIVRAIPDRKATRLPGIEYCDGWTDYANMGISVIGAYDYADDRYRVFLEDNLLEFVDLAMGRDILVSYNGIHFDNRVIEHTTGIVFPDVKCYDILIELWAAAGLGPEFNYRTHGGYTLDAVSRANGGSPKSGSGALAPVLWQRGRHGEVINYCLSDVKMTKGLFDIVLSRQPLLSPVADAALMLRNPTP